MELKIDFGKAAADYAVHRQGFPSALFDRLATLGVGLPGQRVLDLGTGTGLPDAAYDLVSAGTCWHWFDRPVAVCEARRLLRPAGRLVIAQLDWQFLPGNVCETTMAVIDRFAPTVPGVTHTFSYPSWLGDLTAAGFDAHEIFGFSTALTYSHAAWRGRTRASARIVLMSDPASIAEFDAELGRILKERFPAEPLIVDHRVFAVVAWTVGR